MFDMNRIIDRCDLLLITLDTLRFDVAQRAYRTGRIPNLARWLPAEGWQRRHSPANFTFAAHHAFFAGFLPTPVGPGPHPRLLAARFLGSETTTEQTFQFEEDNLAAALANRGYRTICIGGVGFFNKLTPLGRVLPEMFQESYWSPELGVTHRTSTENQVALALRLLGETPNDERVFLFINVSAMHQPNYFYLEGATADSPDSQLAALSYADGALGPLFEACLTRGPTFCIVCSDHGTAYGEDGLQGHRLNHPVVGDVPYADFVLSANPWEQP